MADNMLGMIPPMIMMSSNIDQTNKILITLFVTVVSFLIKYMGDNARDFKLNKLASFFWRPKAKAYILKARVSYKHNTMFDANISQEFKSIQNKLYNTITGDANANIDYTIDEHMVDGESTRYVCMDAQYEVEPGIMIKQHVNKEHSEKDDYYTYFTYTFEISSKHRAPFRNVLQFIEKCKRDYDTNHALELDQTIWFLDFYARDNSHPIYKNTEFVSTKTFDNMFFQEKDMIRDIIDKFENGYDMYQNLGIPHTLGLFFYGAHGTGKTSCAKAIANYTGRHVILVSLAKVKTAKQFANLFLQEYLNGNKIPIKNRLYVFDDFDCSSWRDIIAARSNMKKATPPPATKQVQNQQSKSDIAKLASALRNKGRRSYEDDDDSNMHDDSPITLGDVLEILDGFVETSGRMIICISNCPDDIDPAITRPGRIDTKIEFHNLRKIDVCDMYKLWFDGNDIPPHVYNKMRDSAFSQAEIGKLFKTKNIDLIHSVLSGASPLL